MHYSTGSDPSGSPKPAPAEEGAARLLTTTPATSSTVRFQASFLFEEAGPAYPPGAYEIVVEEELIQGLSWPAYHRAGTFLRLPAIGTRSAPVQLVPIDAQALERAMRRDRELQPYDGTTAS